LPTVRFEYIIGGQKYIHTYDENKSVVPREGVEIGEKYLVLYLKNDPQKSRILFDFPIRESTDFKESIQKFELALKFSNLFWPRIFVEIAAVWLRKLFKAARLKPSADSPELVEGFTP
jgi:hypothetical protein